MNHLGVIAVGAALLAGPFVAEPARAQAFPGYNIPNNNFTWVWGDPENKSIAEDIRASGTDAGFRCELNGKLRFGSGLSELDINKLEQQLQTSLSFIQETSDLMNLLDRQFDLDWATLACAKPEPAPVDEATRLERETRAKEKMQKELARRRAEREQGSAEGR
jgi:hypothetical protein